MANAGEQRQHDKSETFVRLLSGIQRRLYLYVLMLLPNPAEAEEVVQNVSVILWRRFDDFRLEGDFFRWACGIARNEVFKYRQRQQRWGPSLSQEFLESVAEAASSVAESADRRRDALQECLEELQPHHRQLLTQRYLEQVSTDRLAEISGKSVEAVRRMLHRIRLALLKCIERKLLADESASPG